MKSSISKLKNYIKTNKFQIFMNSISFCIFFLGFLCASLCSIGLTKNHYESIARKMGNDTYVCEVISNDEKDNYRKIFDYADDLAGAEIKRTTDTFVLSKRTEDYIPAAINSSIFVDTVFQQTTWSLEKYNYGFKTLSGKPVEDIGLRDMYVDEELAKEVAENLGCSQTELIGKEVLIAISDRDSYMTIKDIIVNFDELGFSPYLAGKTMLTSYPSLPNSFKYTKYVAYLRGGYLSKNYSITYIENTVSDANKETSKYSIKYYKLENNKLIDNGIQDLRNKTAAMYKSDNKKFALFAIVLFLVVAYMALITIFRLVKSTIVVILWVCTALYLLLISFLAPFIISYGTIYLLANSYSSLIIFYMLIALSLVHYFFKQSAKKKEEKTKC